jgi:integrase
LSAFFAWASSTPPRFKGVNPVNGTRKRDEESRERVLTDAELAAIWNAADLKTDYGRIVRLLMLTGCRRNELGGLQWSEIALGDSLIALPGERTKTGKAHTIPLSEAALRVLESTPRRAGRDYVLGDGAGGFNGWSKAKIVLDARSGVSGWTLHDLRRTAATGMEKLGVLPVVVDAVLSHVGHKAGVTGIYQRYDYAKEKRSALEAWATHLATVIARAEVNAVAWCPDFLPRSLEDGSLTPV